MYYERSATDYGSSSAVCLKEDKDRLSRSGHRLCARNDNETGKPPLLFNLSTLRQCLRGKRLFRNCDEPIRHSSKWPLPATPSLQAGERANAGKSIVLSLST